MKCNYCGFETNDSFTYCPDCGKPAYVQPTIINPAVIKFKELLKNKEMLTLCILISVAAVFGIASSSIPLLLILASVFLWLTYSKALKGEIDITQLKNISGTVYAGYVINYVAYILLLISGIIFVIAFSFMSSNPNFIDAFINEFKDLVSADILAIIEKHLVAYGWILSLLFIVAAVISIIINAVGMRSIHRFVKTAYEGIQLGQTQNKYAVAAKNWLIVFGVFCTISALTSLTGGGLTSAVSSVCTAAAMFVASSMINKHII